MATCTIIQRNLFNLMQDFCTETIYKEQNDKNAFADEVLKEIIEITNRNDLLKPRKKRFNLNAKDKRARVIHLLLFVMDNLPCSFMGREGIAKTLRKNITVSMDTIDKAIKIMKESGLFFWLYMRNPDKKTNGCKTIVFFYQDHPLFNKAKTFLINQDYTLASVFCSENRDQMVQAMLPQPEVQPKVEPKVENQDELTLPRDLGIKNEPKKSFFNQNPLLQQDKESKYNKAQILAKIFNLSTDVFDETLDAQVNEQMRCIVKYVSYKIANLIAQGVDVKNLGAYAQKILVNEIHRTNKIAEEEEKKQFEALAMPVGTNVIPFFNWLETDKISIDNNVFQSEKEAVPEGIIQALKTFYNTYSRDYIIFIQLVRDEIKTLGLEEPHSVVAGLSAIKSRDTNTYMELIDELHKYTKKHKLFQSYMDNLEGAV